MNDYKEKIEKVQRAIDSSTTPKEFIPELKKRKADLETQMALQKQEAESEAKKKAKQEREEIAKKEAEAAAKKAKMRKQIVKKGGVTKVKMVKKKAKQVKRGKSIKSAHIPKAVLRGKRKANMVKLPKYVKSFNSGRSKDDIKRDSQHQAMAPGKHRQKRGSKHKFYYERRANRTDVSPKWKLAEGGPIWNDPTIIDYKKFFVDKHGVVYDINDINSEKKLKEVTLHGKVYRYNTAYKTYNSIDDNKILMVDHLKMEKGGYPTGGNIPNNYLGKDPIQVWNAWSVKQRIHFLSGHDKEINERWAAEGNVNSELDSKKWYSTIYSDLPLVIKETLARHIQEGQYGDGGSIYAKGGKITREEYIALEDKFFKLAGLYEDEDNETKKADLYRQMKEVENQLYIADSYPGYKNKGGSLYAKGGSFEKCPVGTKVQTLIFSNKEFTESSAKSWAEKNGLKYGKVDVKPDSFRLRQEPPFKFKKDSFRTIELGHSGIKAVVGCPRNAK